MLQIEEKMVSWTEKHLNFLFFFAVTALALIVRYAGRDLISDDMNGFLLPWLEEMKEIRGGGLPSLQTQIGDYNLLYQTILACMTYFKGNSTYLIKAFSVVFDFVLAFLSSSMVINMTGGKAFDYKFMAVYATVLSLPTVILNGAYWGQCDSIWTAFVIWAICDLFQEKYVRAFAFLGVALAFKLQTIFILPFIITYYFYKKRFSITLLGVSALTFWASGIVAYLYGRDFWASFTIYFNQTTTYEQMYMNVASFWVLVGNDYSFMQPLAICLTVLLLGFGLYTVMTGHKRMDSAETLLNTAVWFQWVCILFLPAMHERYTYLLDVMLVLLCFVSHHYIKYALVSNVLSTMTYGNYLFGTGELDKWFVLLYLIAFVHYTYVIVKQDNAGSGTRKEGVVEAESESVRYNP